MYKWEKKVFDYVNNHDIYNKLKLYVNFILEKNKEFNLTGFDEETIWLDGIYQSIVLLDKFISGENYQIIKLLDIGAGAGFPSIPFLIFSEVKNFNLHLTIHEPIKKRCNFLQLVKNNLNLKNLEILNCRTEDTIRTSEVYDFVTARAVMPLNMLVEISSHCGKIGSNYIFLKSKDANNELENSKWILNNLSIKDVKINTIDLSDEKIHNVITFKKSSKTPVNFPRTWAKIKKTNNLT